MTERKLTRVICPRCGQGKSPAEYFTSLGEPTRECQPCRARRQERKKVRRRAAKTRTYVVVSDVHVPYQDPVCCAAVGQLLRDLAPTGLIVNGDFLDFYELSRYNSNSVAAMEGKRIVDTFAAGNKQLDEWLALAGPQCRDNHFLDGNHEGRLKDWLRSGNNSAFLDDDSLDIGHRLRFKERNVTYHRGEHSQLMLGNLIITHGRWCNKYHAAKHLDEFRHSVLYGHTHAPQTYSASAYQTQQVATGTGHLADPESPACEYAPKPNRWMQGFALVHVRPDGLSHAVPLNFFNKRFHYAGRDYGAA